MAWMCIIIILLIIMIFCIYFNNQSKKESEKEKQKEKQKEEECKKRIRSQHRSIYWKYLYLVYDSENTQTLLKAKEYLQTIDGIDLPIVRPSNMSTQDYRELRELKFDAQDKLKQLLQNPYWTINGKDYEKIIFYPELDIKYIEQLLDKRGKY